MEVCRVVENHIGVRLIKDSLPSMQESWQAIVYLWKSFITNIYNIDMIQDQQKYERQVEHEEEDQPQSQEDQSGMLSKLKPGHTNKAISHQYFKAKKMLTRMINDYLKNMKSELMSKGGRVEFNPHELHHVQTAISKYITIRYKTPQELTIQKNSLIDDLLYYVPEKKSIWKFGASQKMQIIDIQPLPDKLTLPDNGTPVCMGSNVYLFDGASMNQKTGCFEPVQFPIKINLVTGQSSALKDCTSSKQQLYRVRMKSLLVKNKGGVFIIGGFCGPQKMVTSKCQFFNSKTQQIEKKPNLKRIHKCPTGCLHKNKVYVFSEVGIDCYDQTQTKWVCMPPLQRLISLPFQFCLSISDNEILVMGGKCANRNSQSVSIVNLVEKTVDVYGDILPIGVSNERSWGPSVFFGHAAVISGVQASKYPYISNKENVAEIVYFGNKGCFLKEMIMGK